LASTQPLIKLNLESGNHCCDFGAESITAWNKIKSFKKKNFVKNKNDLSAILTDLKYKQIKRSLFAKVEFFFCIEDCWRGVSGVCLSLVMVFWNLFIYFF